MVIAFHRSIVAKLALLISICLVVTISINSWQNGSLFYQILNRQLQDNTVGKAKQVASTLEGTINSFKGQMVVVMQNIAYKKSDRFQFYSDVFAKSNKDFAGFYIVSAGSEGAPTLITESAFLTPNEMRLGEMSLSEGAKRLTSSVKAEVADLQSQNSTDALRNLSHSIDLPILMIAIPFKLQSMAEGNVWAVLCLWQDTIVNILPKSDTVNSLVMDRSGSIISASSLGLISSHKPFSNPIVKMARKSASPFGFKGWHDKARIPWLGAYSQTSNHELTVVVYANGSSAFRSTLKLILRSALWTILLVLGGMLLSYLAASSVSRRLIEVAHATQQIATGNFAVRLSPPGNDEIGILTKSVAHMATQIIGLLELQAEKVRMQQELETAVLLQNTFFPKKGYESPNLRIGSFFQPASECGGDWWGHFPIIEELHLICIADATGHGVPAALITAIAYSASTLLATFFSRGGGFSGSMSGILTELNRLLCRLGEGKMTLTFFAALVDVKNGRLYFANAGHNFPSLIPMPEHASRYMDKTKSFRVVRNQVILTSPGSPLGLSGDTEFKEHSVPIGPGDKIVLFTDGLIECRNEAGVPWGKKKLAMLMDQCNTEVGPILQQQIIEQAFSHFGNCPLADDVTVVTVEIGPNIQPVLNLTTPRTVA